MEKKTDCIFFSFTKTRHWRALGLREDEAYWFWIGSRADGYGIRRMPTTLYDRLLNEL